MKSEKPPEAPPKSKPKKADPREDVVAELLGEEGDPLGLKGIEVKDQGGWSYEFMRDGSIKILTAPKKNKKAIGLVLTKGKPTARSRRNSSQSGLRLKAIQCQMTKKISFRSHKRLEA